MSEEYKCANCDGVFEKGWNDEEATEELEENFGIMFEPSDCAIVCDDCYRQMMGLSTTSTESK